jgi:predicted metal-binding protein
LELLLKIEQYKYKMMGFEHYKKLISGPCPLCKESIEQIIIPELVEFFPAEGVKMEVEDGEEV